MRSLALLIFLAVASCGTAQRAAAKDPMKCERDPSCANHLERTRDCATQCSDDPACMDRCREMQQDGMGHR